jgi:mannose-6-phosphate isomerase-like protein (cupin superfamily)
VNAARSTYPQKRQTVYIHWLKLSRVRGDGTSLHVHEKEDEHIIVVEGTARFACGDKIFDAQPGDVATLRKGIPHAWGNRTNTELRIAVFARTGN